MSERLALPSDPHLRRRLWREWIHTDSPRGEAARVEIATRVAVHPAAKHDQPDWLPEVIDAPGGVIHGLKRAVSESLVGDLLPIADRERLLMRAMKLGLSRFDANLLIAAVQNRARENPQLAYPPVARVRPVRLWQLVAGVLIAEGLAVLLLLRWLT